MQYNCCPKHTIVLFWAIFRSDVKENKKILYLQRVINYNRNNSCTVQKNDISSQKITYNKNRQHIRTFWCGTLSVFVCFTSDITHNVIRRYDCGKMF